MLEAIRKHSSSLLIKALFGLLILTFIAWGIGDFIRGHVSARVVAEVDGVSISPSQFNREYELTLNSWERMFRTRISRQQAQSLGLVDGTMARMINETLYDLGARSLGVVASDQTIRANIEGDKSFADHTGHFNRSQFEQILASNGFTEQSYVARLREALMRQQVKDTIETGAMPPKSLIDEIYRFRAEKRVAETVFLADSAMTGIGQPTAEELAKFHKDHAAQFTAPQYRQLAMVFFTTNDMEKTIKVTEQEIKDQYSQRQGEFQRPEMRHLEQIVVPTEAKANEIYKLLTEGRDFATVAKNVAGLDKQTIDMGEVSRNMLLPQLAGPAFSLAVNTISKPIKSPLGWHILKVVAISPARAETLAEARPALITDVKRAKALDALFKMANKLSDTLAGGATVQEAAKKLNLPFRTIAAVDAQGKDPKGNPVTGLPPGNAFLKTAFETPENQDSLVTAAGSDAYFVVHVAKVIPSALRPLDTIRGQVVAAWTKAQRESKAKATAEAMVKRLKNGATIEQIASELGVKVKTTQPFTRVRSASGSELPPTVIVEMFKGKVGDVASGRESGGYVIARLKGIQPANPTADKAGVAAVKQALVTSLQSDIQAEFAASLRQRFPVTVYQKVLDQAY